MTRGGKIHEDLMKAQKRREALDAFINKDSISKGLYLLCYPMMEDVEEGNWDNSAISRKTDVGFTRRVKNPHGLFEMEIRFNYDPLYMKAPSGCHEVRDTFEFFQNRWVLFVTDCDKKGIPTSYVAPFKVAWIPKMMRTTIERCFWMSEDSGNANRMNCKISGKYLTWIPIEGSRTLLGSHPSLCKALSDMED